MTSRVKKLSMCVYILHCTKWTKMSAKQVNGDYFTTAATISYLSQVDSSLFSLFQIFVSIFSFLLFLLERSGRGMCSGQAIMANKDPSLIWLDSIFLKTLNLTRLAFFNQKLFLHFIIEHNNVWSNPNEWHIPNVKTRDIVCIDWEWFNILYFAWQINRSRIWILDTLDRT